MCRGRRSPWDIWTIHGGLNKKEEGFSPVSAIRSGLYLGSLVLDRCLRGCQARNRHAVRRAGDIVEANPVAELDRRQVAAMLAAEMNPHPTSIDEIEW